MILILANSGPTETEIMLCGAGLFILAVLAFVVIVMMLVIVRDYPDSVIRIVRTLLRKPCHRCKNYEEKDERTDRMCGRRDRDGK